MNHEARHSRLLLHAGERLQLSWKVTFGISLSVACIVLFLMQMYCGERYQAPQGWEQTTGRPVGLRVAQSMPRGPKYYYGECLVEYKVEGKSYKIWAAAGIADRDMHYV